MCGRSQEKLSCEGADYDLIVWKLVFFYQCVGLEVYSGYQSQINEKQAGKVICLSP
jgi:hypothetical protein